MAAERRPQERGAVVRGLVEDAPMKTVQKQKYIIKTLSLHSGALLESNAKLRSQALYSRYSIGIAGFGFRFSESTPEHQHPRLLRTVLSRFPYSLVGRCF